MFNAACYIATISDTKKSLLFQWLRMVVHKPIFSDFAYQILPYDNSRWTKNRLLGMKLSRGSAGLEANYAMGPGRNLKSSGCAMSRCYSRKPLGYLSRVSPPPPPPLKRVGRTMKEGRWSKRGKEGRVSFSKLERKFAQLNETRCLPLVSLIVLESTTGAESKNKGNTSRAFLRQLHAPSSLPPQPWPRARSRWNRSLREAAIYFPSLVSIGSALKDVHLLHYLTGGRITSGRYFIVASYKWGLHRLRAELYLIDRRFARPVSRASRGILITENRGEISGG